MPTRKRKSACCDASSVELPSDSSAEQLAQLAWAVAHPARVRIVRLLISRQSWCVVRSSISSRWLSRRYRST